MERAFTFGQLIEISEAVRVASQTTPDVKTRDLVMEHLIAKGVMFSVEVKLFNDSKVLNLGEPFDTFEFWSKEEARDFVKEFNNKHGYKGEGVDYLEAVFYE